MGQYRTLDTLAGSAVTIYEKIFALNKTNRLYQGIRLYVVRKFAISMNPLYNGLG
jgi:hypothetical protein